MSKKEETSAQETSMVLKAAEERKPFRLNAYRIPDVEFVSVPTKEDVEKLFKMTDADFIVINELLSTKCSDEDVNNFLGDMELESREIDGTTFIHVSSIVKNDEWDVPSLPIFEFVMKQFFKSYVKCIKELQSPSADYQPKTHMIYFDCSDLGVIHNDRHRIHENMLDDVQGVLMKVMEDTWYSEPELEYENIFICMAITNNCSNDPIFTLESDNPYKTKDKKNKKKDKKKKKKKK